MINPPSTDELALLAQSTFADTAFLLTEPTAEPQVVSSTRSRKNSSAATSARSRPMSTAWWAIMTRRWI